MPGFCQALEDERESEGERKMELAPFQEGLFMHLIVLLGIVSLFGDIAYSGARSVVGPYLFTLGASATIVGLVTGVREFSGFCPTYCLWLPG